MAERKTETSTSLLTEGEFGVEKEISVEVRIGDEVLMRSDVWILLLLMGLHGNSVLVDPGTMEVSVVVNGERIIAKKPEAMEDDS